MPSIFTATPTATPSRRNLLAGAGAAGAAVVAVSAVPLARQATAPVAAAPLTAASEQGGYQATAHVLRYYQTARV
jgi:hypothetical protein